MELLSRVNRASIAGPLTPCKRPPARSALPNEAHCSLSRTPDPSEPEAPSSAGAASSVSRAAGLISLTVIASRLIGFLRDAIIAAYFGQGAVTDAYIYAFRLPDTLYLLVAGGAFSAAFVPVVTAYFTQNRPRAAWKTFSILATFLFVLLSVVIPLCWIFARPLFQYVLARGLPDFAVDPRHGVVHPLSMTVEMTRIVLPAQYAFFIGTLMQGMLQARKQFLAPALAPVIYNLGIILGGVALAPWLGIRAFSWGALGGALVGSLLLQGWALRRIGARFVPSLSLGYPGVRRVGQLVLPVIFGVSLPQTTQVVNSMFVAGVAGANTILEFTNRLMQLPLGIFGQAIGIAVLPTLSQQAAQEDMPAFRRTLNHGVRLSLFLTVPASALMIVLAEPLIAFVYQRGQFTAADTQAAVPALVLFSLGVGAWSAQAVLARAFYARHDTWTPVILGTISTLAIFVPLNFVLTAYYGAGGTTGITRGPALATSLASCANTLMLLLFAARRFGGINGQRIVLSLSRVLLACLPMAGLAHVVEREARAFPLTGTWHAAAVLAAAGLAGTAGFLGGAVILRCEEVNELLRLVRRRRSSPS